MRRRKSKTTGRASGSGGPSGKSTKKIPTRQENMNFLQLLKNIKNSSSWNYLLLYF
jgi:hypothetical protein